MNSAQAAIVEAGIIAIMRGNHKDSILDIARALHAGGIRILEVTMNSPHVLDMIELLSKSYGPDLLLGAGTVLDTNQVEEAASAGASFIVSPDVFVPVIEAAMSQQIEPLPGAFTATEVRHARRAGARLIKLFPAEPAGPGYVRQLRAPRDDVLFIPTGGVRANDAPAYFGAGAAALGIGGELVGRTFSCSEASLWELQERARRFCDTARTSASIRLEMARAVLVHRSIKRQGAATGVGFSASVSAFSQVSTEA